MASYEQLNYCRKCHKNVSLNDKGQCSFCNSTQIKKSWTARFRFIKYNGVEIQKRLTGFSTKKEAQNGYIEFINQTRLEQPITDTKIKFPVLYDEYKAYAKNNLKESSYYDFCSKCDLHILPYFKDFYIQDLTPKVILAWQTYINGCKTKANKEYSYKYKRNLRAYLRTILNYAEKYYDVKNNLKLVDNFKNTQYNKEMQVWSPEEFNSFIEKVSKPEYKAFFYALYYTGARKGEILATTWDDWNLTKNTLKINKSITKKVYGQSWLITTPKNQSSVREISIPPVLSNVMKEFKENNKNNKFVFFGDKPLADSNIQRIQETACKEANVKKIRLHDFRHSHASFLLSQGVSVVAVAKRLGHKNIEQTLNTYAHMMPREDDALINILQKASTNLT